MQPTLLCRPSLNVARRRLHSASSLRHTRTPFLKRSFKRRSIFTSNRNNNATTNTITTTRSILSQHSSRWSGVGTTTTPQGSFQRWLSTNPTEKDDDDSDSDSDSEDEVGFSFDSDDDEEEAVEIVNISAMSPEEEAKMIADINKMVADELKKIEAQSQVVMGNRWGSHVTDRTLTAAESRYVRLGAEQERDDSEENVEAADLLNDDEGSKEGGGEGEVGVDVGHKPRPAPKPVVFREKPPMSPTWYDKRREMRKAKLNKLKRRGKGPPKKGSGKRGGKK